MVGPPVSPSFYVGTSRPGDVVAIGDHGVEDTDIADTTGGALLAFGLVTSAMASPAVIPFAGLRTGWQIALPFMECSTRYIVLLDFFHVVSVDNV